MRKRGELVERTFAHLYETGGMRRVHLRGHRNILKRLLIHAAAGNLGLVMRAALGSGTPRGLPRAVAKATPWCFALGRAVLARAAHRLGQLLRRHWSFGPTRRWALASRAAP